MFFIDKDRKKDRTEGEDDWSLQASIGRVTQKVRGKRLDSSNTSGGADHKFVETPADSLVRSVRSLSRRASLRDWLDASKERFVKQYSDLPSKFGQPYFPDKIES